MISLLSGQICARFKEISTQLEITTWMPGTEKEEEKIRMWTEAENVRKAALIKEIRRRLAEHLGELLEYWQKNIDSLAKERIREVEKS